MKKIEPIKEKIINLIDTYPGKLYLGIEMKQGSFPVTTRLFYSGAAGRFIAESTYVRAKNIDRISGAYTFQTLEGLFKWMAGENNPEEKEQEETGKNQ